MSDNSREVADADFLRSWSSMYTSILAARSENFKFPTIVSHESAATFRYMREDSNRQPRYRLLPELYNFYDKSGKVRNNSVLCVVVFSNVRSYNTCKAGR